jgi:phosphatidylserine/phosphatidylglycerophosphate/cardiolipin synthase-like enzyme
MNNPLAIMAVEVARLADLLPEELLYSLAAAIEQVKLDDWAYARAQVVKAIPQPEFKAEVSRLLQVWQTRAPNVSPQSVALALLAAANVGESHRCLESIDLVWTGPDSHVIPLRRTDQALLQLINEAATRLTIISFAVYKAEAIAQAILQAAQRGVDIAICLETPNASEGKIAFDTLHALGDEVVQHARIYVWPLDQRPQSSTGKHGSLHAKVAVADGETLLISSANLTEYAMTLNMELGVLIRGGELPARVEQHFERLIQTGVLRRV